MDKNRWMQEVFAFLEMFLGTALNAAAFGLVIVPQGFAAGGITGFSRVLCSFIPLPLSVVVFLLNMLLLVAALAFVGKAFLAKTLAVSFLFPVMLEVFSRFSAGELLNDPMMSALAAGALLGVGTGLVLRSGASSGGFDIVGVIFNNRFGFPVANVMNICDTTVIILQALRQPLMKTMYGVLVIFIVTVVVTRVVTLGTGESQVLIFSQHHDVIRDTLLRDLDVGITSLRAESGYEKRDMMVIVSVMPYQKVAEMKRIIMAIDPAAFVVVDQIHSVLGKGYTMEKHHKLYHNR